MNFGLFSPSVSWPLEYSFNGETQSMFCTTVLPTRPIDTDPFCAAHCKIPVIRDVMRQETRMNKLLTPPGSPERWADGIVVCFVGVACFLVYYLIEFDLCGKANCGDLVYTKFWANMAELKGLGRVT